MELYSYYLGGVYPLDWEFCFLNVDEYKRIITEKYQMHNGKIDDNISDIITRIDEILSYALEEWKNEFGNYGDFRCPPMIFPMPKGDESNGADFCIILKRDNDGDTIIYSPIRLSYLENC